jgi:hypothetical protein
MLATQRDRMVLIVFTFNEQRTLNEIGGTLAMFRRVVSSKKNFYMISRRSGQNTALVIYFSCLFALPASKRCFRWFVMIGIIF